MAQWGSRSFLYVAVGVLAISCGSAPPPVRRAPRAVPIGSLETLAPPGSTLVAVARPSALMDDLATRRVIEALFPREQLDGFAARTGIDVRALRELVIVIHPAGRVAIARGPFDAPFAVREAGERMAPVESSADEPFVRRAGLLGNRRIEVAALASDAILWVDGTPMLAARVLASARTPENERRHALLAAPLPSLRETLGDGPFVLYAPEPLGIPRDTGIGMLLARERALGAVLRPQGDEAVEISSELRGEFPPGAHDNFRALAESIAESELGAALGARDALPTLRIEAEDRRVRMTARVDSGVLAAGLRTLLVAEMSELLDDPRPPAAQ